MTMSNTDTKTIFCFLPGTKDVFPVHYNERTTFGELKVAIKDKMPTTLGHIEAHLLTIYKISVGYSDGPHYRTIIGQISEGVFQFDQKEELYPPTLPVSSSFQEQSNIIEILVELPEGESI